MKVTGLKTMVVETKPPYIGGKYFLFLELQTDQGTPGIGERVAGMAEAHYATIAPHMYCGPVAATDECDLAQTLGG